MSPPGPPLPTDVPTGSGPQGTISAPFERLPHGKKAVDWSTEQLERAARRTLGEVLDDVDGQGQYAYEPGDRLRAAAIALPKKSEISGANGGPIPIHWNSPVNPHALRKAKR